MLRQAQHERILRVPTDILGLCELHRHNCNKTHWNEELELNNTVIQTFTSAMMSTIIQNIHNSCLHFIKIVTVVSNTTFVSIWFS